MLHSGSLLAGSEKLGSVRPPGKCFRWQVTPPGPSALQWKTLTSNVTTGRWISSEET